jgi:hypothetical protein
MNTVAIFLSQMTRGQQCSYLGQRESVYAYESNPAIPPDHVVCSPATRSYDENLALTIGVQERINLGLKCRV